MSEEDKGRAATVSGDAEAEVIRQSYAGHVVDGKLQPETDLPGIISHRATLRLTRLELVTLLQRIAPDLPTSAGVEPDQDGGVRLSWDE